MLLHIIGKKAMTDNFGFDPEELGLKPGRYKNQAKGVMHVHCPFHGSASGKTAVFNFISGDFYCYSCHQKSNAAKIASKFGGRVVRRKLKKSYAENEVVDWKNINSYPIDVEDNYLRSRKVTPEQITKYKIRTTNKGVAFPMIDGDKTVGFLIRQENDTIRYVYGGEKLVLWPMQNLTEYDTNKPLYLVEGVFGALRGLRYGHQTLATLGTMIKKEIAGYLNQFDNIIGVFDDDDAGYVAGWRLLSFLPQASVIAPGWETDELIEAGWASLAGKKKVMFKGDLAEFVSDKDFFDRFKPRVKR
jgi:hypothetical protein